MKKTKLIIFCCMLCFCISLVGAKYASAYVSFFWVKVLDANRNMVENAYVEAVNVRYPEKRYPLTFQGWGYYNKTMEPGVYNIIINGKLNKTYVEAPTFYYAMSVCCI